MILYPVYVMAGMYIIMNSASGVFNLNYSFMYSVYSIISNI